MGSNATYLFSPPRQPINYNTAENVYKWWDIFSDDQGSAFDKRGWPYYTKEWHEHWFPGYGSGWPCFLGVIGILYEQAGVDGLMVQQQDGYVLTYHEAINHQFTSSLANLTTLANNRKEIMRDYHNTRRNIVLDGEKSGLTFFVAPDDDELKVNRFITGKGGTISDTEQWGKRRLAYPIKHFTDGRYFLIKFNMGPAFGRELEASLKISEEVLRHLLIKSES